MPRPLLLVLLAALVVVLYKAYLNMPNLEYSGKHRTGDFKYTLSRNPQNINIIREYTDHSQLHDSHQVHTHTHTTTERKMNIAFKTFEMLPDRGQVMGTLGGWLQDIMDQTRRKEPRSAIEVAANIPKDTRNEIAQGKDKDDRGQHDDTLYGW